MLAPLLATLAAVTSVAPAAVAPSDPTGYSIDSLAPGTVVLRTALSGNAWGGDRDPMIEVRADGTVTLATDSAVGGYVRGRLSAEGLDTLVDAAADAELLSAADYGELAVTDVGTTVVAVTLDGGSATHAVWGLGIEDFSETLTPEQVSARSNLGSFLADVDAILGDPASFVEPVGPFVADRLYLSVGAVSWDGEGRPEDPVTIDEWPLSTSIDQLPFAPDFDGLAGCTTLVGDDAAAMQQAIDEAGTDGPVVVATGSDRPDVPDQLYVWASAVTAPRAGCAAADDPTGTPGPLPDTAYLPLTGEVDMADVLAASPWPVDGPTASMVLERLAADPAFFTAIGAEIGQPISWVKATWFDVVAYAGDVDGQRSVILRATCSRYIADEFDMCELWGRFDVSTGDVVDVDLRPGPH